MEIKAREYFKTYKNGYKKHDHKWIISKLEKGVLNNEFKCKLLLAKYDIEDKNYDRANSLFNEVSSLFDLENISYYYDLRKLFLNNDLKPDFIKYELCSLFRTIPGYFLSKLICCYYGIFINKNLDIAFNSFQNIVLGYGDKVAKECLNYLKKSYIKEFNEVYKWLINKLNIIDNNVFDNNEIKKYISKLNTEKSKIELSKLLMFRNEFNDCYFADDLINLINNDKEKDYLLFRSNIFKNNIDACYKYIDELNTNSLIKQIYASSIYILNKNNYDLLSSLYLISLDDYKDIKLEYFKKYIIGINKLELENFRLKLNKYSYISNKLDQAISYLNDNKDIFNNIVLNVYEEYKKIRMKNK